MSPSEPRAIIIILMGSLGDLARGLSLVDPIKTRFPGVRLTWLVEPACLDLLRLEPRIDRVLVFHRERGLSGLLKVVRELRREKYDLCLDLQRHLKSGFFSLVTGARRRIGFHPKNSKEFNWIFNTEYIDEQQADYSKLLHYQKFLVKLGLPCDAPRFALDTPEVSTRVHDLMASPAIALVLSSSWSSKNWPNDYNLELCRQMLGFSSYRILLIGTSVDEPLAKEICTNLKEERIVNLVGKTSLPELAYVMKNSLLTIGPDSGPAHVAAALHAKYLSIFGPTDPRRVAPYGSENLVLQAKLGCVPCGRRRCPGLDSLCMRLISPRDVAAGALNFIVERASGKAH